MLLQLQPAFKDYLWGGQRLKTDFGFETPLDVVAEGWMLSCHKDGENVVLNGAFQGKTLSEVIESAENLYSAFAALRSIFSPL